MLKYYQNKETGELISYDPETGKVSEFREITLLEVTLTEKPDRRGRKARGGVEHKRPYHRKVKELQDFATGKAKKEKKVNWRTLNKMKELKKAGYNSGQIAEELGLQLETVNKHYPKI